MNIPIRGRLVGSEMFKETFKGRSDIFRTFNRVMNKITLAIRLYLVWLPQKYL